MRLIIINPIKIICPWCNSIESDDLESDLDNPDRLLSILYQTPIIIQCNTCEQIFQVNIVPEYQKLKLVKANQEDYNK